MDKVPLFISRNKQLSKRVADWSVEEDGIFVSLKRGFCFEPGEHVRAFDTRSEAVAAIKAVRICNCSDCRTGAGW